MQLGVRAFGERGRAAIAGELDRPSRRLSALAAPVASVQLRAQVGERVSQLQPRVAAFEHRDRFLEQRQPLPVVSRECGCPQ